MNLRDLFLCKNFGPQASGDGGSGVVINNQNRTFTENGIYNADAGYTGLGTVTVDVPEKEPVVEPLVVTENGEYTPGSGVDGFSPVTVNVESAESGVSIPGIKEITFGEFTPVSDVSTMTIAHGLSGKPDYCAVWATGEKKPNQLISMAYLQLSWEVATGSVNGKYNVATATDGSGAYATADSGTRGGIHSADDTDIIIGEGNTVKYLTASTVYCWIAIRLVGMEDSV